MTPYITGLLIGFFIGGTLGIAIYAMLYAAREDRTFGNSDGPPVYVSRGGVHFVKPRELFESKAGQRLVKDAAGLKVKNGRER